ncbi:MAG: hypothetical protein Q9164_001498 [Protoblastenia rupestris]
MQGEPVRSGKPRGYDLASDYADKMHLQDLDDDELDEWHPYQNPRTNKRRVPPHVIDRDSYVSERFPWESSPSCYDGQIAIRTGVDGRLPSDRQAQPSAGPVAIRSKPPTSRSSPVLIARDRYHGKDRYENGKGYDPDEPIPDNDIPMDKYEYNDSRHPSSPRDGIPCRDYDKRTGRRGDISSRRPSPLPYLISSQVNSCKMRALKQSSDRGYSPPRWGGPTPDRDSCTEVGQGGICFNGNRQSSRPPPRSYRTGKQPSPRNFRVNGLLTLRLNRCLRSQ